MILADVEFRHDGHAAQRHDAAEDVRQHARPPIAPIHILEKKNTVYYLNSK